MPSFPFMPTAEQTFVLEVPAATPADAEFYLQTNLSGYAPALPEYRFVNGVLRAEFPIGALLTYKITRGSTESEEGDAWGERRAERRTVIEGAATHRVSVQSWQDVHGGAGRPSTLAAGIDTLTVHSPELKDDFTVLVWTPPGYAASTERLPALYLHDGQNVFDAATSFAGEPWAADAAARALAAAGLPCLLVAVCVRPQHRGSDYVPVAIRANDFTSTAPAYQTFLARTLKPHIDARYRTRPEPRFTAQAGSSFGGVASIYGTLTRPDVWGLAARSAPACGCRTAHCWISPGGTLRRTAPLRGYGHPRGSVRGGRRRRRPADAVVRGPQRSPSCARSSCRSAKATGTTNPPGAPGCRSF